MKRCSTCLEYKQTYNFVKSPAHKDGYHGVCKPCRNKQRKERGRTETKEQRRKWKLKGLFNLSVEQWELMRKEQNYRCAICDKHEDDNYYGTLYVDHDHSTGKVRALLCNSCNSALGQFEDNIDLVYKAADYLDRYKMEGY